MSGEKSTMTRAKAIRVKCLDCCGGNSAEVRRCASKNCALWPFRMGRKAKGKEIPMEDRGRKKTTQKA